MDKKLLNLYLLLLIGGCVSFFGCGEKEVFHPKKESHFIDEDFILIQKNVFNSNEYTFLIQSTSEPNYFFLWTEEDVNFPEITTQQFYSYGIGDTLHYDYIQKNRFFKCENIKLIKEEDGKIQQRRNH
jgi:hypothetical protein